MQYYDKKAVGERIKAIRVRNGMTQSRLAEELDYTSERQLQRIESGELPALWISWWNWHRFSGEYGLFAVWI